MNIKKAVSWSILISAIITFTVFTGKGIMAAQDRAAIGEKVKDMYIHSVDQCMFYNQSMPMYRCIDTVRNNNSSLLNSSMSEEQKKVILLGYYSKLNNCTEKGDKPYSDCLAIAKQ